MVSPDYFGFNLEAFETNTFMHRMEDNHLIDHAKTEFANMKNRLEKLGVEVNVLKSKPNTPDAVFPNNWFASHIEDNKKILSIFPMLNPSRRLELQPENLVEIINPDKVIDLRKYEKENRALEGTGSIVFDREYKKAYACLSPRTNKEVLISYLKEINYEPIIFEAYSSGKLIYHTNVLMGIGEEFAIICLESITDQNQKEIVFSKLQENKESVIQITLDQMNNFCGNVLELISKDNKKIICMSETSYNSFTKDQLAILSKYGQIEYFDIKTIETIGGGSVRCMIGELFIE